MYMTGYLEYVILVDKFLELSYYSLSEYSVATNYMHCSFYLCAWLIARFTICGVWFYRKAQHKLGFRTERRKSSQEKGWIKRLN